MDVSCSELPEFVDSTFCWAWTILVKLELPNHDVSLSIPVLNLPEGPFYRKIVFPDSPVRLHVSFPLEHQPVHGHKQRNDSHPNRAFYILPSVNICF